MDVYRFLLEKYGTATITPDQFATECHSHPTHIRQLCRSGTIKAVQVGQRWKIPLVSAAAFLDGTAA